MCDKELVAIALKARLKAYAPYSKFKVGAALLTCDVVVFEGCNIENASYTPTSCAERTAFFQAILKGERKFSKIVICGGKEDGEKLDYCAPCGVCRQVMMEFCDPETFEIILAKSINEYQKYLLKDLLPLGFGPNNLI